MREFTAWLQSIAKRPAIYVGKCSIRAVSDYLHGYCHALGDVGHAETPLDGWGRWIELRGNLCVSMSDATQGGAKHAIPAVQSDRPRYRPLANAFTLNTLSPHLPPKPDISTWQRIGHSIWR